MSDYLLKFPSKEVATQFGLANGFATTDQNSEVQSSLASHEHALCVIGEHNRDGQWWVLFRDLVGIPIPSGAEKYIHWASTQTTIDENGETIPMPKPISEDTPNVWWA